MSEKPRLTLMLASPRGFCAGVEMAIKALAWMVRAFEPPVYCYHEIVHNKIVVQRFEAQGVVFVDDIAEVPEGRPIMLSAHGSAPEVVAAARARGSYVVDSVCPLVTKVHHEVKVRAGKGFRIVYVGHEGHEEAVGTMAVAPDAIHRVESVAEVLAGVDLFGQGEFQAQGQPPVIRRRTKNPREAACYTFGYNPAVFAQRVRGFLEGLKYRGVVTPSVQHADRL